MLDPGSLLVYNETRSATGNPADHLRETMLSIGMKAAVQIADRFSWLLVSKRTCIDGPQRPSATTCDARSSLNDTATC
jgi:hypothetical protein